MFDETVKKQSQKVSGLSNLKKVSFRRIKIDESIPEARASRVFSILGDKKGRAKKPRKTEELKVIIELSDERVDMVSFVESVINFKSKGNNSNQSTD